MNKIDTSLFSAQEHALDKEYRLCPECGGVLSLRRSKHGLFLGCENYPTCQYMRPLQQQSIQIEKILDHSACPECGQPLAIKKGRFGLLLVVQRIPSAHISKLTILLHLKLKYYQHVPLVVMANYRLKHHATVKRFMPVVIIQNANMQ